MEKSGRLFYGDNLTVMRKYRSSHFTDESVQLVYLDPPFNSNRSYNVLFETKSGEESQAQIEAFDDTWVWSQQAEEQYEELVGSADTPAKVVNTMESLRHVVGTNDMLAYLVMMTPRLLELHRVLKADGSLYLHCDPTASHYLKIILDSIFGPKCYRNEIIWRRTGAHGKVRRFGPTHDVVHFYTKSDAMDGYKWNGVKKPYMRGHVEQYFVKDERGWRTNYYGNVLTGSGVRRGESGKPWRGIDPTAKGRHWAIPGVIVEDCGEDLSGLGQHEKLDRLFELGFIKIEPGAAWPIYEHYLKPDDGVPAPDIWAYQPYTEGTVFESSEGIDAEVRWLSPRDGERLGYPTQKPLGLLERIIKASTDPGDLVLDPFCGCGTTVAAAEKLSRRWIGIDITFLAIDLIRNRLETTHGPQVTARYDVHGVPRDMQGAAALFNESPFEFERWAVSLIGGKPNQKQVADRGSDGVARFYTDKKRTGRILISVKGGQNVQPAWVRDLLGTVETEGAEMGILIMAAQPTRGLTEASNRSGLYKWPPNGQNFPKIQIITVHDLLRGQKPQTPPILSPYVDAKRKTSPSHQLLLKVEDEAPVLAEDEDLDATPLDEAG